MLIADRLRGKQVAVLFVGPVDANVDNDIARAVTDAGGSPPVRIRALKVPLDTTKLDGRLDGDLAQYKTAGLEDLGREFARELVDGGDTPAWDALTQQFVEEKIGSLRKPVDGVIVARTVKPQGGQTATFLSGFYKGLGDVNVPTIGVEPSGVSQSAVPTWSDAWSLHRGRHRHSGRASRTGAPARGRIDRELRPEGERRRRDRPAARGRSEWLTPPRSSSRRATRRPRSRRPWRALREQFPGAEVIVADDGSRDATAALAEQAGARVLHASTAREGAGADPRRGGRAARFDRARRRRSRR